MDGIVSLVSVGAGIASWIWLARWLSTRGKGWLARHGFGLLAFLIVPAILAALAQAAGIMTPAATNGNQPSDIAKTEKKEMPAAPQPAHPAKKVSDEQQEQLSGFTIVNEEIIDSPIKTQIELRVTIPRGTTRRSLSTLLERLFHQQMSRSGFKARPNPNSVYIFAYLEGDPTNGVGWVGRAAKSSADAAPTFDNELTNGGVAGAREALGIPAEPGPLTPTVEELNDRLKVSLHHAGNTEGATTDLSKTDMKNAWRQVFDTLSVLFWKLPDVKRVQVVLKQKGKVLADVTVSEADFAKLKYDEAMQDLTKEIGNITTLSVQQGLSSEQQEARELEADLAAYRILIKRLPTQGIVIDSSVKP